jgi:hypothetical protein
MKVNAKLKVINGQLAEYLIKGAVIVLCKFDGYDFHVLVKLPKGYTYDDRSWSYAIFETSICSIASPNFSLMSHHNRTPRDMDREFSKGFYEDYGHKKRNSHKYDSVTSGKALEVLKSIAAVSEN